MFSNNYDNDGWVNEDFGEDSPIVNSTTGNSNTVDLFADDISNGLRTRTSASMSSGVVLQPSSLSGSEAKLHNPFPVLNGPYSNPLFVKNDVDMENK